MCSEKLRLFVFFKCRWFFSFFFVKWKSNSSFVWFDECFELVSFHYVDVFYIFLYFFRTSSSRVRGARHLVLAGLGAFVCRLPTRTNVYFPRRCRRTVLSYVCNIKFFYVVPYFCICYLFNAASKFYVTVRCCWKKMGVNKEK